MERKLTQLKQLKEKLKAAKKLAAQTAKTIQELENQRYYVEYPEGRFVIQYRDDMGLKETNKDYFELHWAPVKRLSRRMGQVRLRSRGISIKFQPHLDKRWQLTNSHYQNCSFGACTYYRTFDKFLAGCARRKVPETLIQAFKTRYALRNKEGF